MRPCVKMAAPAHDHSRHASYGPVLDIISNLKQANLIEQVEPDDSDANDFPERLAYQRVRARAHNLKQPPVNETTFYGVTEHLREVQQALELSLTNLMRGDDSKHEEERKRLRYIAAVITTNTKLEAGYREETSQALLEIA